MDLDTPQTTGPLECHQGSRRPVLWDWFPISGTAVVTRCLNNRHFLLTGPNQHDVVKAMDQHDVLWTGKLVKNTRAHTVDQT